MQRPKKLSYIILTKIPTPLDSIPHLLKKNSSLFEIKTPKWDLQAPGCISCPRLGIICYAAFCHEQINLIPEIAYVYRALDLVLAMSMWKCVNSNVEIVKEISMTRWASKV